MICFKPLCLLLLLLIFYQTSLATTPQVCLDLTAFNSSNGLSQNTINVCLKDSYGFMWFGTQDGLNKYDGYQITVYKHHSQDSRSLPANYIAAICEDRDGNLWVGTRMGGLSRYNRAQDAFTNFKYTPGNAGSISNNNINCIYHDRSGNLWIGTDDGLNLWDRHTGRFRHFFHGLQNSNTLSSSFIYSVFESKNNQLWIGTDKGPNLLNRSTGACSRLEDTACSNYKYAGQHIYAFTEDEHHNLWMGTNKGLTLLNPQTHAFYYFAADPDRNSADGTNPVFCMAKASSGKIWLGTNTTLQLFDTDHKRLIPICDKTADYSLMPNDAIYSLLQDQAGILWIGTSSQGILKYDRHLPIFPTYKAAPGTIPSAKNIIRSMAQDAKGNLYLATDAGLEYFDYRHNASLFVYQHNRQNTGSLLSNYTTDVIISKKTGLVWIGTSGSGLDCLNPETRTFKHYTKGPASNQLNSKSVGILLEDHEGKIWVGTNYGGINVLDPATGTFTRYLNNPKNTNTICDNTIQALYEDRQGNIWIGSYSGGISIYHPATRTFTHLNTRNSNLSSNIISDFQEDAEGRMWISTMEGGLNCYDPKTRKFTIFSEQNGLPDNTVLVVQADRYGYLWITTNQGLTRINPKKGTVKNFDRYNGLKTLEFNIGSGINLQGGEIAVGNINGFNIINPAKISANPNRPPVVITSFELFNKPVVIGNKGSLLNQNILTTKAISLNYNQSVFTLAYAALDYTVPELNQYAYRLEGFDENWQYAGNQRKATYTNLNPGTYTFRVKAANNDGVWANKETTFIITIKPPFWMTWWCRTIVLLLIAALAYAVFLYRKKQQNCLKKLEEEQFKDIVNAVVNAQEEERRRIAEALHNEFGQLLFIAKMHIPAQHAEAAGILNDAIVKVRSISYELMPPILQDYGLEYALRDMIAKKLADEHIKFTISITGLKQRINQPMEVAIYRIIQELLNNVVKHARASFVEITVIRDEHKLSICLTDNGVGLPQPSVNAEKKKKEFGLNYIINRIHLLKGEITMGPGKQNGTETCISLPLSEIS